MSNSLPLISFLDCLLKIIKKIIIKIFSVGGATATGDGDVMMRFSSSFLAVELLRNGLSPQESAENVIDRIQEYYPRSIAAILVVDKNGNYGAACQIFDDFPISIFYPGLNETKIETIECRQFNEGSTTTERTTTAGNDKLKITSILTISFIVMVLWL